MHIIPKLLQMQNNIKLYHWMTTSYSRHIASDKLYEQMNSHIDKFVEVFIGKYERPKLNNIDLKINASIYNDKTMIDYIDDCVSFMIKDIFTFINENDVDLLTIRDDIVTSLNQTKYLFTLK